MCTTCTLNCDERKAEKKLLQHFKTYPIGLDMWLSGSTHHGPNISAFYIHASLYFFEG
jgi:hypothetical protein